MKILTFFFIILSFTIPLLVYIGWIYLSNKDVGVANMGFGFIYLLAFFIHIIVGVLWSILVKKHLGWYATSLVLLFMVGFLVG